MCLLKNVFLNASIVFTYCQGKLEQQLEMSLLPLCPLQLDIKRSVFIQSVKHYCMGNAEEKYRKVQVQRLTMWELQEFTFERCGADTLIKIMHG